MITSKKNLSSDLECILYVNTNVTLLLQFEKRRQEEIESLAPHHSMSAADLETKCRIPDLVQSSMACHITTSLKAIAELNVISPASKSFPNDSLDTLVMPCEGEYV